MKRIVIIDDHPMVRKGMRGLIEEERDLQLVGEAADMATGLSLIEKHSSDLAIVDLSLSGGSGFDLIRQIKLRFLGTSSLVVSMYDERLHAERALTAGARGYVNKCLAAEALVDAIRTVLQGKIYLSVEMKDLLMNGRAEPVGRLFEQGVSQLSNRELTVFELIGEGLKTSEIARHLSLSVKTIESHQYNIKVKLGVQSARQLDRRAMLWHMEQGVPH